MCDRSGDAPTDERDRDQDDDGDAPQRQPEAVDAGGHVAGVECYTQRAVDGTTEATGTETKTSVPRVSELRVPEDLVQPARVRSRDRSRSPG